MSNKEQSLVPKVFTHARFGKLRIVVIDGVIYFVAIDVARALGYKNGSRDVNRHVDEADRLEYRLFVPSEAEVPDGTPGQMRKVTLINKSGLYSLILDSQLPKAKEYRHWVTSKVLPTIDETGSYSVAAKEKPALEPERPQLKLARVYVLEMSDGSVKIGYTKRFCNRMSEIKRQSKLSVKNIFFTAIMSRENARLVERCTKEIFSSSKLDGEFFSVKFDEACAAVDSFAKMACVAPIVYSLKRGGKILKIAGRKFD